MQLKYLNIYKGDATGSKIFIPHYTKYRLNLRTIRVIIASVLITKYWVNTYNKKYLQAFLHT